MSQARRLKGGQMTRDRRLDRVRDVDLSTLDAPVTTVFPTAAARGPRSKRWVDPTDFFDLLLDQDKEGACVGAGFGHDLLMPPQSVEGVDMEYAREEIYYPAQDADPFPGGERPGSKPRMAGTTVKAGGDVLVEAGFYREVRWAFTLRELLIALGWVGPAVIGVDWKTGMWDTDDEGYIHATGDIIGGHCVCLSGVELVRRPRMTFKEHGWDAIDPLRSHVEGPNSWGPRWGIDGFFKLALVDLAILFPAGDFAIPVRTRKRKA